MAILNLVVDTIEICYIDYVMKQKGVASYYLIFLAVVIIAAGVLVGGMSKLSLNNSPVNTSTSYVIENDIPSPSSQSNLQLRTIQFREVPPLPAANCNIGPIKGKGESDILWATIPGADGSIGPGGSIRAFHSDEWPMTLGSGTISTLNGNPGHVVKPVVGDINARDVDGFPYFPAIFLTDITSDPTSTAGDAPSPTAIGYPPSEVYGVWKVLGNNLGTKSCRDDSTQAFCNKLKTGDPNGAFPPTSSFLALKSPNEPFTSAEVIWNVNDLPAGVLQTGHRYRVQIVVHDGDRAGDLGVACTTIKIP